MRRTLRNLLAPMSRQPSCTAVEPPSSLQTWSIPELRSEVTRLERDLEDRKLDFLDLCERSGTSTTVTPAHAAVTSSVLPPVADAAPSDLTAEARRLAARNGFLAAEIKMLEAIERKYAKNPCVLDKQNELKLVRMQIAHVEHEIATLQAVKKRRDVGLRVIGKSEEQARRVRGQQQEANSKLREEVKMLMEELKALEKKDFDVHEKCARLQDQIRLSVTGADVRRLRDEIAQCDDDIKSLSASEAALRQRRATVREEDHCSVAKMRRECTTLEEEEARLQQLLQHKDLELKRSYQAVGRHNVPGGIEESDNGVT